MRIKTVVRDGSFKAKPLLRPDIRPALLEPRRSARDPDLANSKPISILNAFKNSVSAVHEILKCQECAASPRGSISGCVLPAQAQRS